MEISDSGIKKSIVQTSFGKIHYSYVGKPEYPMFLIIHGSGTGSNADSYSFLLHEYAVRYQESWKIFMVSLDCPGYGKSEGLRSVIRAFPTKFISEFSYLLTGKRNVYILFGHSQGGNSVFNACLDNPQICSFLVQDRPVCGDIKKLKNLEIPTFLVYDEEDDGHPIRQGKQIVKTIKNFKFIQYKGSVSPYWTCDHLIDEIIKFIYEFQKYVKPNLLPDFNLIHEFNGVDFNSVKIKETGNSKPLESAISAFNNSTISLYKPSEKRIEKRSITIERSNCSAIQETKPTSHSLEKTEYQSSKILKAEVNLVEIEEESKEIEQAPEEVISYQNCIKKEKVIETPDLNCSLCLYLMVNPIKLPCRHSFCLKCIEYSLIYCSRCPLCRQCINFNSIKMLTSESNVDKELQQLIFKSTLPNEYEQRVKEVKDQYKDDYLNKKVYYGISYKFLGKYGSKSKYQYKFFVKTELAKDMRFIKQVDFDINPHIKPGRPIKTISPPFEFERSGSYEYPIEITVYFTQKIEPQQYSATIELNFSEESTFRAFIVKYKN